MSKSDSHSSKKIHDSHGEKNSQDAVQIPREEYDKLLQRVKDLEGLQEKLLRSAADFDNAKKRLTRERDEFVKFSQEALLRSLLPVLDNFERALSHAESLGEADRNNIKGVLTGIQMVYKQLQEILKNQGVIRIQSVGQIFDPHRHEAIGHVQGTGREDEVVEEVEPGYFLNDRLLRAAKVRVRTNHGHDSGDAGGSDSVEEKQEEIT